MPENQNAQKRSQKIQSILDKRRNLQKDSTAAEEEMLKLQEELKQKEERVLFLSNEVDKNKMADGEMAAKRQRLQAGEERRTAMLRKQVIAAWRPSGNRLSPWERTESRPRSKGIEKWELPRSRCQEEKKEVGTVKMNKITVKPVSSWCYQRKAGSMKALQRVVRSLIFLVFGVRMVNAEEQGAQVQQKTEKKISVKYPRRVDFRWKMRWKWHERASCVEQEEKRNSQGKDPRTLNENSQGGVSSTLKLTARERTQEPLKKPVEKWRVQKKRKKK